MMTGHLSVAVLPKTTETAKSRVRYYRDAAAKEPERLEVVSLQDNRVRRSADASSQLLPDVFSDGEWTALRDKLSIPDRQLDVARWICRGCTNSDTALRLGVSLDTVRMHTKGLYKNLNVRVRLGVPVRLMLALQEMNGRQKPSP